MIQEYKHPLLSGKPCMIHTDFVPSMDLFCRYLEITGCKFFGTSWFRDDTKVKGAIVVPAKRGNHLIGFAGDGNIIDKKGELWNSKDLKVFTPEEVAKKSPPNNEVLQFINLVRRSKLLRWGGDFNTPDEVHFDTPLNITNPQRWDEIYKEIHS